MNDSTTFALAHKLIALAVPAVLWAIARGSGGSREARLRYSGVARFFAVFAFAPSVAIAVAATFQTRAFHAGELRAVLGLLLFFPALGIPLALEFFRVNHRYDDAGWNYRSPWSANGRLDWSNVATVEWRPVLKWLTFTPVNGSRRFHVSPLLRGLDGFAQLALKQIPAYVFVERTEAHAVLRLMAAGQAATLLMDSKPPSKHAAGLAPHTNT